MTTYRPSELQCERTIIAAARLAGWRVHAERAAQARDGKWSTPIKGDPGFPDLILARGGVVLAVELKRSPNRVTEPQKAWLNVLDAVPGVQAFVVVVPEDQDRFICEVLL